ncbi:MAG: hypothetical protein ACLU9S_12400 [Oscillospiraceae bacterium]
MIITQKKPIEELLAMLEGVKKVAIVGCANCAAACQTGGEKEIQEMKTTLEAQGMEVVATVLPDECCHKMLVKKDTKVIRDSGAEAVVGRWPAATVSRPWRTICPFRFIPPTTPCSWARWSGWASSTSIAGCAVTAFWAPPAASAPLPSAPKAW